MIIDAKIRVVEPYICYLVDTTHINAFVCSFLISNGWGILLI